MKEQARAAYEALTRDLTEDELDRVATLLNDQERGEIGLQGLVETILAEFGALAAHDEAAEIIANMIQGIESKGLYSQEGTLGFLSQAYYCLRPANAELAAAPAQPAATHPKDNPHD